MVVETGHDCGSKKGDRWITVIAMLLSQMIRKLWPYCYLETEAEGEDTVDLIQFCTHRKSTAEPAYYFGPQWWSCGTSWQNDSG